MIPDKTRFEHANSKFGECRYTVHTERDNFLYESPEIGGGVVPGPGVGSTLLRSTIFGENSTPLRSTLLKRVVFDKIEKSTILKIVVIREVDKSTLLKRVVVREIESSIPLKRVVV